MNLSYSFIIYKKKRKKKYELLHNNRNLKRLLKFITPILKLARRRKKFNTISKSSLIFALPIIVSFLPRIFVKISPLDRESKSRLIQVNMNEQRSGNTRVVTVR